MSRVVGSVRHLVVTGMPGVGKSTVSDALASRLGWPQRDSDDDIATLFGVTGRELAISDGVDVLHRVEAAVLLGALAASPPHVIAAAGSVIDDARCRTALGRCASLFVLVGSPSAAASPVFDGGHRRPISAAEMTALVERRTPLWHAHATAIVGADRPTEQIADEILELFSSVGGPS